LNWALWRHIAPQVSPLYIAAVMIAAWIGGLGPGLFATALAGLTSIYLFMEPRYSFHIYASDILRLVVFLSVAMLVSWLNGQRKNAELSAAAARDDLEQKVIERTTDLERINVELREQQQKLRDLSWRLSQTEEEERRRIASALHDGLGQLLAVAAIKMDAMSKIPDAAIAKDVADVRGLLDQALTHTRSLTIDLSPPVLYELGLKAAVVWLAQEMETRYGLKVEIVCGTLPEIDQVKRSVLFHSIRELLINVAKHAKGASARVVISYGDGTLEALVEDNGKGFDIAAAMSQARGRGGFGLFNVRERIHHLAGTFSATRGERGGTRVRLTVPVIHESENNL
jgi:signal transduction histidine kinase